MYNVIALSATCPHCNESLLDSRVMIDNEPSIMLNAVINNQKMWIRLSSVWESCNFQSEKPVYNESHADFSCPHCNTTLNTQKICDTCGDKMVRVRLLNSGEIFFCSRRGCANHTIEIDDIKRFLQVAQLKQDVSLEYPEHPGFVHSIKPKGHLMKSAYLDSYCPHCHASLIDNGTLSLEIINGAHEKGVLYLSPYLDIYSNSKDIEFADKIEAEDLRCRSCGHTLFEEDSTCGLCSSQPAKLEVKAMSKMVSLKICPARGCPWQMLSNEDLNSIFLEDSQEW